MDCAVERAALVLLLAGCAAPAPEPGADFVDPDWRYGLVEHNVVAPEPVISTRAQPTRLITIRADDGEILEIASNGGGFAVGSCVTLEAGAIQPAPDEACRWFAD